MSQSMLLVTNMGLVILFDIFLNPSFKMATSFTRTTALAQVNLYTRKDFKLSGIGSLIGS